MDGSPRTDRSRRGQSRVDLRQWRLFGGTEGLRRDRKSQESLGSCRDGVASSVS